MTDQDITAQKLPSNEPPSSDIPTADKPAISTDADSPVTNQSFVENPFDAPAALPPTTSTGQSTEAAVPAVNAHPTTLEPSALTESRVVRETPVDPRVAALRAMFPDFEDQILQSVLESVGGDQDRAVDALLGMSDPDYRSDARPVEPIVSQTELDEQLARRLMLEDEAQQQQAYNTQQTRTQILNPYSQLPPQPQQQLQRSAGESNTMAEFQDQFNKIAETGKKTFGTLFSKVKAKMQEFEQPRTGQGSMQPTWSGTGAPGNQEYQPYFSQQQQQQQQPAYYDPNPQTSPASSTSRPAVQAYDTTPNPSPALLQPPNSAGASSETPRPPQTGAGQGAPIDGGKLGLLPKRPVSLLGSQPSLAAGGTAASIQPPERKPSEDEELEYTENPFEDERK